MGRNQVRTPQSEEQQERASKSIFTRIEDLMSSFGVLENGIPIHVLLPALYLTFLGVLYVWNGHHSDRTVREYVALEKEVNLLKADYKTLKKELMGEGRRSKIVERASRIGLGEDKGKIYTLKAE